MAGFGVQPLGNPRWIDTGERERRPRPDGSSSLFARCVCSGCGIAGSVRIVRDALVAKCCARCATRNLRHGEYGGGATSVEMATWRAMHNRCSNPNADNFDAYGGRGIRVCERWRSFENFLADMGRRPAPGLSLERKDNDGNYDPSNCRWATADEQRNNRRCTIFVDFRGERLALGDVAKRAGVARKTLYNRHVLRGWDIERAITAPPGRWPASA